ncbi:MAG: AlwI family type II restriction endonuclease [Clostridia bacterium]
MAKLTEEADISRKAEYKPLSFSTTMRSPQRIAAFLNCVLPFEGEKLNNEIIHKIVKKLIFQKLYKTTFEVKDTRLKGIFKGEEEFSNYDLEYIIANSPQNHKESGFDKGWPSRFDTWFKLPMEFGFIFYEIGQNIVISVVGHMLIDAFNEIPQNGAKIQNVFLNALIKYQSNNPFRKNANANVPLLLLLNVIKELKNRIPESTGIFRKELALIICWPNADYNTLVKKICEIRNEYGFSYSDEIVYDICLGILGVDYTKKKRFKINQITGEAIDEFIRKMRITGIISLRGNGRFLDINTYEIDKVNYVLEKYSVYPILATKKDYFEYVGAIDNKIIAIKQKVISNLEILKMTSLNYWAKLFKKEEIYKELIALNKRNECKNEILRVIDRPTRMEFLASIALKQTFTDLVVIPNYSIDDEGLPIFTAAGGLADIECFDKDCNPLFEVTLMTARTQATNEMPAITRHLIDAIKKYPDKKVFAVLVAPTIHIDTKYMAEFSKHQYNVDILTLTILECVEKFQILSSVGKFIV